MTAQPTTPAATPPSRPTTPQPATPPAQFRVLQSRRAPAQRSLFAGLLR
ncbi:MAG: hypothetical protein JSR59_01950 [Proteobacteria bacterium]|nr:hypothetical protein [Pseudomonadota bacterium]